MPFNIKFASSNISKANLLAQQVKLGLNPTAPPEKPRQISKVNGPKTMAKKPVSMLLSKLIW